MKRDKLRSIPVKNYVYLGLIFLGTIFILYYIYLWHRTYQEGELNKSIMSDYLTVINYNEINDYIAENSNAVIYVSKLGDEQIIKFEKSFRNTIVDNNLKTVILYLDVTGESIDSYSTKFKIDDNLPYIVVYTGGEVTDTYSIVDNEYSTKKLEKYLNRIGITDDD